MSRLEEKNNAEKLRESISSARTLRELGVVLGAPLAEGPIAQARLDFGSKDQHEIFAALTQRLVIADLDHRRQFADLLALTTKFSRACDVTGIAETVRYDATDTMGAHRGFLYLLAEEKAESLVLMAPQSGDDGADLERVCTHRDSPVAKAFRERSSIFVRRGDPGGVQLLEAITEQRRGTELQEAAAVPLLLLPEGEVVGVLLFTYLRATDLTDQRHQLCEAIAAHAALAVERMRRVDREQTAWARALLEAVQDPLSIIQVRAKGLLEDAQTYGHEIDVDRARTILRNVDVIDKLTGRFLVKDGVA